MIGLGGSDAPARARPSRRTACFRQPVTRVLDLRRPEIMQQGGTGILVFELGDLRFGLRTDDVQKVVRCVRALPLPRTLDLVEGLIDAGGEVVPVLDIRARFRLPPKPPDVTDHMILARSGARPVALRVDHALSIVPIRDQAIADARSLVPGADYISGVARLPDGLLLIHDLATFLSATEAEELDVVLVTEAGR